jgi:hypothetical protein
VLDADVVEPGAPPTHPVGVRPQECGGQGAGGGRVADPHLAHRHDPDLIGCQPLGQLDPDGDRLAHLRLAHRRPGGGVGGAGPHPPWEDRGVGDRPQDAEIGDDEACARLAGEDADGGAPGGEVAQHLLGHLGGVGADALSRDAVVGGADDDRGIEPAGPGGAPDPSQAAGQ